jgi:hypothetical protein
MVTLQKGGYRIEAAAVPEAAGYCCVTAEVFEGRHMVRGYYRRLALPSGGYHDAEQAVAEDVARMSSESE